MTTGSSGRIGWGWVGWWLLLATLTCPLAAQEVATVEVRGEPVFTVAADGEQNAAARARELSAALQARLDTDEPLAPLRVVQADTTAAVVIGQDTLVRVTPRDAELVLGRPVGRGAAGATRRVAAQWADALHRVFQQAATQERARVVVQGTPLFEVTGTAELRAARRAATVGIRIAELASSGDPPPRLQVSPRGSGAVVLADGEVLLEVNPADAAASDTTALAVAQSWAGSVQRTVERLREQRSWTWYARVVGVIALATLLVAGLHWALRRVVLRFRQRPGEQRGQGWGLLPLVVSSLAAIVQFLAWSSLLGFALWVIPRTRPLTFAALAQVARVLRLALAWVVSEGLVMAMILVTTVIAARFVGAVVRELIRELGTRSGERSELRADTFAGIASGTAQVVTAFVGLLGVLAHLEIDAVPLLASAGVAGIAIGFGVQSLIRDFFTGLFILLEDQYGVGDLIQVGGVSGKVERFTLRITQIRGLDGSLTSVPNGEITTVTNLSKDWSQVVLDVNIALGEDVDRATAVIERTANNLSEVWADRIQGAPEVLGVETVDPLSQAITIRVVIRTAPLERWTVARELRRRVLDAFREEDIQVPPRSVLTVPERNPS